MREIKFRAWWQHKEYNPNGTMYFVGGILFATQQDGEPEYDLKGDIETGLMSSEINSKIGWNKDCILMQYTGLKDKNGKEIYEGDIVEYKYLNTLEQETRKSEVQLMPIGDVNRNIQAYYPFCYSIAGSYKEDNREITECYLTPSDACEIIGNIYENPEILSGN